MRRGFKGYIGDRVARPISLDVVSFARYLPHRSSSTNFLYSLCVSVIDDLFFDDSTEEDMCRYLVSLMWPK